MAWPGGVHASHGKLIKFGDTRAVFLYMTQRQEVSSHNLSPASKFHVSGKRGPCVRLRCLEMVIEL